MNHVALGRRAALVTTGLMLAATPAAAAAAGYAGASAVKRTDVPNQGVAAVKVSCPTGTDMNCTGTLSLTSAKKVNGKYQSLGKAHFMIDPGKTGVVHVKLTSQGRALLAKAGKIVPVATVVSHDGANHPAKRTSRITLKAHHAPAISGGY